MAKSSLKLVANENAPDKQRRKFVFKKFVKYEFESVTVPKVSTVTPMHPDNLTDTTCVDVEHVDDCDYVTFLVRKKVIDKATLKRKAAEQAAIMEPDASKKTLKKMTKEIFENLVTEAQRTAVPKEKRVYAIIHSNVVYFGSSKPENVLASNYFGDNCNDYVRDLRGLLASCGLTLGLTSCVVTGCKGDTTWKHALKGNVTRTDVQELLDNDKTAVVSQVGSLFVAHIEFKVSIMHGLRIFSSIRAEHPLTVEDYEDMYEHVKSLTQCEESEQKQ